MDTDPFFIPVRLMPLLAADFTGAAPDAFI